MTVSDAVVWHDVECGGYDADLPLWRALAEHPSRPSGPVLDLGAGTGRVALDLARRGHEVHALDVEPALLDALHERGSGLPIQTHAGDARHFDLGLEFALVLAPMQTLQLLGGSEGRRACLRAVRRHLAPGGRFAAAIAETVERFGPEDAVRAMPDMREVGGVVYSSRPTAVRIDGDTFVLERLREKVSADGRHEAGDDATRLDRVDARTVEEEGRRAGLQVLPRRSVASTADHVGSEVVVLGG